MLTFFGPSPEPLGVEHVDVVNVVLRLKSRLLLQRGFSLDHLGISEATEEGN